MTLSCVYKAEGIILRRKNVGEADRILTIFTKEYGKLRVIAKGIRKVTSRRGPHLEIFTRGVFVIHSGKTIDSVSEVQPRETYQTLRSDLKRVSLGYYCCELIDSLLPEKQEQNDVYSLLLRMFHELDNSHGIYKHVKVFTLELLWSLGFLPREKALSGSKLQSFIENITERKLKTPPFARRLYSDTISL